MAHDLDRAEEAIKKFGGIFDKGGGHCDPEAQGICDMSLIGGIKLTPLTRSKDEKSSADKIHNTCDEVLKYILHKHNITVLSEIREVSDMCHELKKFLLVKNERYGDSALNPIKVFSKGDASDKIDIRMDDKLSRIIESDEQRMNDFVDLTGYLVLKCIDKGWTDFSELLD